MFQIDIEDPRVKYIIQSTSHLLTQEKNKTLIASSVVSRAIRKQKFEGLYSL